MQEPFSYPIGFFISRTYAKIRILFLKKLETYQITPEQFILLTLLSEDKKITLTELSQISIRDKPSTIRLIEKLEKRNFIRREQNQNDKRSSLLSLTKKGGDFKREISPVVSEINKYATKSMSEEEVYQLKFLLNKMYEHLRD